MANYKANRDRYYQQNYYTDGRNNYWHSSHHNSYGSAQSAAKTHQHYVSNHGYHSMGYDVDKNHVMKYKFKK